MFQDVWILKLSVSYAEAQSKLTTCATTLPLIINEGGAFKALWRDPIIAPLKYIPIKQAISGLNFFMWLNFYFCLTLEFKLNDIVYPDRTPVANYMRGNHLQIGWITVGYRNQHKVKHKSSSNPCPKDASQRFIFTQLWMVMAANRHMAVRLSGLGGKWGRKL